jgi:uncharacterized protein
VNEEQRETDPRSRQWLDEAGLAWFSEPPWFVADAACLRVRTGESKDFWRETFYGFVHDDGHFLSREVTGDFTAEATVRGAYSALYDQAGLMLRLDERTWIKAGIEYTDGLQHFSVVVTREVSDWSVIPLPENPDSIDIRLTRHAEAVRVQFRTPGTGWRMARLAYLPPRDPARVGPMCCSPTRQGFEAAFHGFSVGPAIPRTLHE